MGKARELTKARHGIIRVLDCVVGLGEVRQTVIILMGVAGSGKTTVGRLLASEMQWPFYDGDDLHPTSNIEKMKRGIALSDSDREPWLDAVRELIVELLRQGKSGIVACSALKKNYRDRLLIDERVELVHLKGDFDLMRERLKHRSGHFMAPELLRSQFETLEEPEDALDVDVSLSPHALVDSIRDRLQLSDEQRDRWQNKLS
ncbi:MAG: gluconokinase [Candidatus Binatia bacterium]